MSHVYYNVDEILGADLRPGTAVRQGDTVAPSSVHAEPIVSHRDPIYLERLMPWLAGLIERANASGMLQRHGISLAEVARYRLLFALAPWEHRLLALQTIQDRWHPTDLAWIDQPRRREELGALQSLMRTARQHGVPARYAGRPPVMPLWRDLALRSGVKQHMWWRREPAAPPVTLQPADCVFAEYFPNSAKVLVPVDALMRQRGLRVCWLAGRPLVQRALADQGIGSILLDAAAAPALRQATLTAAERRAVQQVVAEMPEDWLRGSNAGEVAWPGLRRVVEAETRVLLGESARFLEAYRYVFDRVKPRAVVSTTYTSIPGRAAALVARTMGARAVFVQHGLINDDPFRYDFCHSDMLMWGNYARDCLLRAGYDADRVHAVGSPIYDRFIADIRREPPRPFPQLGERLNVLYLASRTGGSALAQPAARAALHTIAHAVSEIPGARLVVKPHPADSSRVADDVLAAYQDFTVARDQSSQSLILHSDIVIIVSSTTGFEACLADRPLIVFNATGIGGLIDFPKSGAAVLVERPGDVQNALKLLREDPAFRDALAQGRHRLIAERLSGGRGDAAEQVASYLADLLTASASARRAAASAG